MSRIKNDEVVLQFGPFLWDRKLLVEQLKGYGKKVTDANIRRLAEIIEGSIEDFIDWDYIFDQVCAAVVWDDMGDTDDATPDDEDVCSGSGDGGDSSSKGDGQ